MNGDPTPVVQDPARLTALQRAALLDTPAEEAFDRLTRVACRVLRVPVALVSLVDEDRQFFKSAIGLPEPWASLRETPLSHSFCQHTLLTGQPLVVQDARRDPVLRDNQAVRDLRVVAYLGIPLITADGHVLGAFCVIDGKPREWTEEEISLLRDLAGSVMSEIELLTAVAAARSEGAERQAAQEALRAAHDSFRHLVENSPFGVYAVDADFRLVQVSAGAQKVFENVRPLLGRDFADVLRCIWPEPFATEAIGRFRRTLDTGEPYHSPSTVERRRDIGEVEAYDWKIERVTLPDGRFGVVCHFYDLSERQQYEEALREADRRKDEWLAMLAHELRNPLAVIRNAVALLQQAEPGSAAFQRGLEVARRQIQHQSQIVDDLLDLSRISRGKMELRREPLDLARVTRDTAEDFRREVERRGLTLTVELPEEAVPVRGDRTRLAQVLGNLLHNASKFTPPGGEVRVEVTTDALSANGSRAGGEPPRYAGQAAVVRVTDTGVGIDPEMIARLFEPFAQADRSLDRSRGGLGLGLALVRGLVEMHGGEVRGYSAGEGMGAEFTFYLPLDREPAAPAPSPDRASAPARPLRVLIIEDIPDAADTLRDLLELSGYTVEVAYSGPTGVALAEVFEPEAVLCDIGLPGMDGYAIAEELRRRPSTSTAHLIALTGYGLEEDQRRSEAAGFDLHLTKPVDPDELNRVLASFTREES